jgi:spore maturation protein CgeB
MSLKILIFNWHEGYIHLLAKTGYHFDVVEVRKGNRFGWIKEFRPVPPNCTLISEIDAVAGLKAGIYDRVICQNIDDLMLVYKYEIPKIQVFHTKFSYMTALLPGEVKDNLRTKLKQRIALMDNITLVFVSPSKREDWGFNGEVILPGVDTQEYSGYRGDIEKVLRVGNGLTVTSVRYFHEKLKGVPFTIVGDNPDIPESYLPASWEGYKSCLQDYRVYLHPLQESDDDGYNLAMLEAMATGMPVVSIANKTSPIIDGVNGYISQDHSYLKDRIQELLGNQSLAKSIGRKARESVIERFPIETFINNWRRVIEGTGRSNTKILKGHSRTIFEKNISALKKNNPRLAEAIVRQKGEDSLKIIYSRNGLPSVRVNNITLHSLYDPEREAKIWVQHYEDVIKSASVIFVFGFGLGYHLLELCKRATDREITVFEPGIDILKIALKTVDLSSILSKVKIVNEARISPFQGRAAILQHKPSMNLKHSFYGQVLSKLKTLESVRNGLRILVVSPIYGGSLPVARYCSSALKRLGHNVELMDNSRFADALFFAKEITKDRQRYNRLIDLLSSFLSEAFMARCEIFKPDLVFALAQAPLTVTCLDSLNQHKVPVAYWFVEDFRFMEYWKKIGPYCNYFFTIQRGDFFSELSKVGVKNYYYLPMAAEPNIHKPQELTEEEKNYYGSDISFVGAGYYNRQHFFKGLLDFDFKIWGTDWDINSALYKCIQRGGERVETEEIVKIFNAAKININLHSSTYHKGINPFGDFVNPRTFEIISSGGFQLVDRRSGLDELFEINKEVVVFDSLEDVRNKIMYFLNNPEERKEIIERGRERVMREHTYEHRMKEMLDYIVERGFEPPVWIDNKEDIEKLVKESGHDTELGQFLMKFAGKNRISLSDITEEILNGKGDISKTEAIFLMMKEFVS